MSLRVYDGRLLMAWPKSHAGRMYEFANAMRVLVFAGIDDAYWINEDGVGIYRASIYLAHEVGALEDKLDSIAALVANEKTHGAVVTRSQSTT